MNLLKLEDFDAGSLQRGDEVNLLVGEFDEEIVNILFLHGRYVDGKYVPAICKDNELFLQVSPEMTWPEVLTSLAVFPSHNQAFKNWRAQGKPLKIDWGYQDFWVGGARKIRICLYKAPKKEESSES